ncbi:MAG TPA: crossover junction endodeoxyribonuclease RuvC [Persephonella sp.]|nr:crossover junction endodeoxyribonuclease RuvC [Persephonella sp.]
MRVLGIDPGNYSTGFCVLSSQNSRFKVEKSGTIKSRKRPDNLKKIFASLQEIIDSFSPDEIALESAFYGKNPQSLIRLGEVRGIILLLSTLNGIPVYEYTPQKVKNSITGYGWSKKEDVSFMVEKILSIKTESYDEADAIAVAFCHLQSRRLNVG